jgi:translation initiation factor 2D
VEGEPESIPGPAATEAVEPKEVVTEQETTEDSKDEPAEESEEQLTTEDIDNFFKRSLMQTLTQSKLQPPLPSSQFMHLINSNLITSHPSIQIKKTSWKKSAKFLKAMEKSKFLKLKGKDDDLTIVSISNTTNNEELKNFVPYKVKKSQPSQQQPTPPKGSDTLTLTNYYKPTAPLRPIFNELDLDFISNFNTKSDVKDILNAYITKQNLVNPTNKKLILINGALSKLTKDAALGRDKLLPLFLSKFTEYYKLTTPGSDDNNSPPVKGSLPQVEIITETKIGRKLITRISKVEYFNIDIETFANELKVKCSGSTTIKPKVENPKFSEISVQGPHFKIVNELLTGKYGLNANWISFNDKSKSKKKRS